MPNPIKAIPNRIEVMTKTISSINFLIMCYFSAKVNDIIEVKSQFGLKKNLKNSFFLRNFLHLNRET